MALALALFALVTIGGIVAGNFFAGLLEQQSGRNVLFAVQAGGAAEGELWETMASAPPTTLRSLAIGGAPWVLGGEHRVLRGGGGEDCHPISR